MFLFILNLKLNMKESEQLDQHSFSKQSLNLSQRFSKLQKIFLFLFLIVVIVLIGEVIYYYFFLKYGSKELSESLKVSQIVEKESELEEKKSGFENNRELGSMILSWLDKQKSNSGIYYFLVKCSLTDQIENCVPAEDNRAGIRVIWAKFQSLKSNFELSKKEDLLRDIEIYASKDKIPVLQNDLWNCKLMFDLWNSDLFSKEEKDKIEQICWRGGYYHPPDLMKRMKGLEVMGEIKDIDFTLVSKGEYVFETKISEEDKSKEIEYSFYPSEFVTRYLWHKDINQLKKAKFYFNKAVQLYFFSPSSFSNSCLLGISALDLYKVNQNSDYLNFAKSFLSSISSYEELPQLTYCSFLANYLFEITEEQMYREIRDQVFDTLVKKALIINKDKSLIAFRLIGSDEITLPINENSLIAGLLIQLFK